MFLSVSKPEDIIATLKQFKVHRKEIETQVMEICYWMSGMNWNYAWSLSPMQRNKMVKFISKNERMKAGDKTEYM